ncbi:MAG: PilZ domain-containing protein [Nitrospira sp.]|nr:PilZ domain-containing protein [bacterium]MBL7049261.1 PilZ domain-containing protein [Nitrospira sp.]
MKKYIYVNIDTMSFENTQDENRAYKRLAAQDHCWAELEGTTKLFIKNISIYGTCIIIPLALTQESKSTIKVFSESGSITLTGRVIWSYPLGHNAEENTQTGFETGFKFIDLDDAKQTALEQFINDLNKV